MEVPVRELRDKLSKYLRLVGQGEPIVVIESVTLTYDFLERVQ